MAGLGEVCTHVAAVLFYLEAVSHIQGKETCTSQTCQWILPSVKKKVEYLPIADIDFTSASAKKRKLDHAIDSMDGNLDSNFEQVKDDVCRQTELPSYKEMDTSMNASVSVTVSLLFCR